MAGVRTRFAPSPSGMLHLGSARTALYNWAFARRHRGRFLLRLEDTDRERSSAAFAGALIDGLRWLGLAWDEEPRLQSEFRARHEQVIEFLLEKGRAYRCTCTPAELEERKRVAIAAGHNWVYDRRCRDARHDRDCGPHAVRLRLPDAGRIGWKDQVFGSSGKDASEIGDVIIRRSDGSPLYHLAVVVDDLDMGITHVIRGADHHGNTPLQLAIYDALERTPPVFAHLPLIVTPEGQKLSKRRDDASVQHFRELGYLSEALCNWLVRIGWSHGDQEVFSLDEIARHFELAGVNRASGRAELAKLGWLNQHYLKRLPSDVLFERVAPFLEAEVSHPVAAEASLLRLLDLLRERSRTLVEMAQQARFLLVESVEPDEKAARKHLRAEALPLLADLQRALGALDAWDEAGLERVFEEVRTHAGVAMGKLAQPVRVAVTGTAASPGIFETLAVLGRERTLARIEAARARLERG